MPFLAVFGRFDALLGRGRYNLSLALFCVLKTKTPALHSAGRFNLITL